MTRVIEIVDSEIKGCSELGFSRATLSVLLEVGGSSAPQPLASGDLGGSFQPGLKLDRLELENQRGLAIASERGCLLPGLCRIAWTMSSARGVNPGKRSVVPYVWGCCGASPVLGVLVAPMVNSFDGRCTSSGELDAVRVVLC